jgi:hypothetical protein
MNITQHISVPSVAIVQISEVGTIFSPFKQGTKLAADRSGRAV